MRGIVLRVHTDAALCCCQTIATELGSRFLADYLSGDTYFGTSRPGQNLDRATVQLTLAEAIRTERGRWEALVRDTFGSGSA